MTKHSVSIIRISIIIYLKKNNNLIHSLKEIYYRKRRNYVIASRGSRIKSPRPKSPRKKNENKKATLFRFVARFLRVRIKDSSWNRFLLNAIQRDFLGGFFSGGILSGYPAIHKGIFVALTKGQLNKACFI